MQSSRLTSLASPGQLSVPSLGPLSITKSSGSLFGSLPVSVRSTDVSSGVLRLSGSAVGASLLMVTSTVAVSHICGPGEPSSQTSYWKLSSPTKFSSGV